jgi:N-terminal domain of anti-restriction factor ArdC
MATYERLTHQEHGPPLGREQTIYDGQSTRADKVAAALAALEEGIARLTDSERFKDYLTTMSRFHDYSFNNIWLIQMQRPYATMVAGFRKWRSMDRFVKSGEKGITIIYPKFKIIKEDDEERERRVLIGYGMGYVFDISQTGGKPLPQAPTPKDLDGDSAEGRSLFGRVAAFAKARGASITRQDCHPVKGYFIPDTKQIYVGTRLSQTHALKTLIYETAHLLTCDQEKLSRYDRETLAESAAFVVLSHFGIDSREYSFPYVSRWARNTAMLKRNLELIQETSHAIISGISPDDGEQQKAAPALTPPAVRDEPAPGDRRGAAPVSSRSPTPPAIDPALFPTGQEVQMPLFEAASPSLPLPAVQP